LKYEWSISGGVINNVNKNSTTFSVQNLTSKFTIDVVISNKFGGTTELSILVTISEGEIANIESQENAEAKKDTEIQGEDVEVQNHEGTMNDVNSSFSTDGTRIIFASNRDGDYDIYLMNADGSGQTNLTNNSSSDDVNPSLSFDSSLITFASNRDGDWDIYIMNANGTGLTNLTNNSSSDDINPSFSVNGSTITFTSNRDGNYDIYLMNADGSGQTNLINNAASGNTENQGQADSQSQSGVQDQTNSQSQSGVQDVQQGNDEGVISQTPIK
jgi:Tol biopolymer transport system component